MTIRIFVTGFLRIYNNILACGQIITCIKRTQIRNIKSSTYIWYPLGKSNLYALLLIHSKTCKGPSPRGNNLDFLCSKNSSLTSLCHPLLACLTYYLVLYSMLNFDISCVCLKIQPFSFHLS